MKIAVCVPTAGVVNIRFTESLLGLVAGFLYEFPNDQLSFIYKQSSVIHANREILVKTALVNGFDKILFVDDDMTFNFEALKTMLGRNEPIVIGNYLLKQASPKKFTAIKDDYKSEVPTLPESTGLEEVGAGGFGFALLDCSIFGQVEEPRFLPFYSKTKGIYSTEDVPFYYKARKNGYKVFVDHDASKHLGHIGSHEFSLMGSPLNAVES